MPPLAISVPSGATDRASTIACAVGMPHAANVPATRARQGSAIRWRSTSLHEVPPAPATSTAATPASKSARTSPRPDAPAHLFDDDRKIGSGAKLGDPREQPAKARVAFRLQRLLQRIEMQCERVGFEHFDEAPALRNAVAFVQLHRTEICEKQNLRSIRPHVEAFERFGRFQQSATGAEAHCQAVVRGHPREAAIDSSCLGRSARHARDQKRRRESAPEKTRRYVDVGKIDLGQRTVGEGIRLKTRRDAFAVDVAFDVDTKMLRLSRRGRTLRPLVVQRTTRLPQRHRDLLCLYGVAVASTLVARSGAPRPNRSFRSPSPARARLSQTQARPRR